MIRRKLKKKGYTEQDIFIGIALSIVIMLVLAVFAGKFAGWFGSKTNDEKCRLSIMANSQVRSRELLGRLGSADEKIAVSCPSKELLEIDKKSMSAMTATGSTGAIKYAIMETMAEEMRNCHYRYAGDIDDLNPFTADEGTFCGICREVTFNDNIQELDMGGHDSSGKSDSNFIDYFSTYLFNTKMENSNQYYSEYFSGYKKETTGQAADLSEVFNTDDSINKAEFKIDTTDEYYVTHLVIKGKKSIKKYFTTYYGYDFSEDVKTCSIGAAVGGGLLFIGLMVAPIPGTRVGAVALASGAIAGTGALGCIGYFAKQTYTESDNPYMRQTVLLTKKQFVNLGCIPYGLEKEDTDDI